MNMLRIIKKRLTGDLEEYALPRDKIPVLGYDTATRLIIFMTQTGNVQGLASKDFNWELFLGELGIKDLTVVIHLDEPPKAEQPGLDS